MASLWTVNVSALNHGRYISIISYQLQIFISSIRAAYNVVWFIAR